jgi:type I restriction-modification system DNA methylase subunit
LLNPLRGETVLDPVCGNGQLLLALVTDIERHEREHELVLLGQENRTSQWAITKMQLLLRALMLHRVDKSDALDSPLLDSATDQLQQADVVVLAVPDEAHEWNPASHSQDARFPQGVPEDSRIALIWHALACMKMDSGRLGLLVSGSLLALDASLPLRRYLVDNQLLEAIIQLPRIRRQTAQSAGCLLLIRPAQPTVALIGKPLPLAQNPADKNKNTYCTDDIEAAWNDLRMCRTHPCLQTVSGATIAAQGYPFVPPDPADSSQKETP